MEITFRTSKLKKLCNDSTAATKRLGPQQARKLRNRLDDLRAARNLETMRMLPGRLHELTGDLEGVLSLDLVHPERLLFVPTEPIPRKPDGGLDWSRIETIEIISIEDTHG